MLSDTLAGNCTSVCRTDCTCPRCGDGVTDYQLGEQCDDLNTTAGDGCSASCQLEVGARCGNLKLEAANQEGCDDGSQCSNGSDCTGNAGACSAMGDTSCLPRAGDGCSATCQLEPVGQTCGDGNIDTGELCDDGLQICADTTTSCGQDSDCPTGSSPPQLCLPANGDSCNSTCNFTNVADTFHITGGDATLTVDNTYLWYADSAGARLWRIDVRSCIAKHNSTGAPCTDASGGAPACPDPCAAELIIASIPSPTAPGVNVVRPTAPATDGRKLWFLAGGGVPSVSCGGGTPPTEAYIYELDIAVCDAAIAGGASDCSGLETIVAGGALGHVDGVGAAARLQGLRATTFAGGFVHFLDASCGTLRRFDPVTREVRTLLGDPTCTNTPGFVVGYGSAASLNSPRYMTTDNSGFLYISDNFDHTISRYNRTTNYLDRWVGDAQAGAGYLDAYDGTQARFNRPRDLTSDGTSIYVADFNNYTIRQVDIATTRVTTMVGVPAPGAAPNTKCDLSFGQGAQAGTGARFTKPLTLSFHPPTGSLFFFTSGAGSGGPCAPPCTTTQVANQIWRIR